MKIATVGGGPGGLYCSMLLKKAQPALDITVFEKNPRGATYGWGVVFSDRTLSSFREADLRSYEQIIDEFVIWDAIDIGYRGEIVRATGQVFSGIARKGLLEILTRRCEEVGVEVSFESAMAPERAPEFDLVIAADGIHSLFRESHAAAFGQRLALGRSKFIWFGTPRSFDSFTFLFRDTPHGLFQVHAYPFDGTMSTFIVETSEKTWRSAGLDEADEIASIVFCEGLFAAELHDEPLLSNQSRWISFATLSNRTWRHDNVVLLGDAAHTAHFSIGSGTKLAMEDSIALADSLQRHRDLDVALGDYQLERKPRVERFQEAARQSQSYFESTERYKHLATEQFVFHLLTRSGRMDYSDLRVRDPHLIERVDRWFSGAPLVAPPPAFTPLEVGGVDLANRVVLAPASTYSAVEGSADEVYREPLLRCAGSGAGALLTAELAVSAHGRITPGCAGLYEKHHATAFSHVCEEARRGGVATVARLNHSGPRGATRPRASGSDRPLDRDAWPLLAPSPVAYGRNVAPFDLAERIDDVASDFVAAARLAEAAGFDAVMLEMARGYLLGACISPLTNRRQDDFGGSLGNRMRWPLLVFDAVRRAWAGPLGASLCAHDWERRGTTPADAVSAATMLAEHGCDFVEVSAGYTTARSRLRFDPYLVTNYCDRVRNAAGLKTIVGGTITTVDRVNTIVGGGRSDLCVLRRDL